MRILACGDAALTVELGEGIDPAVNAQVQALARALKQMPAAGIRDIVPTYRSLTIHYDPWQCSPEGLALMVEQAMANLQAANAAGQDPIAIPACFDGDFAPDLDEVAGVHGMSRQQVIEAYCAATYFVYMIGFTPGFPYLGGLAPQLYTPRRKQPRTVVPAGSVGIADRQTGIYSLDSPGGWQIIGRTPVKLFDLERDAPFLLKPGDRLRFFPISEDDFGRHHDP